MIREVQTRVSQDNLNDGLMRLGIHSDDKLIQISCLGEESHNYGRIPMLLTFSNGQKIVYKPRSMCPEYEICSNEKSVFQLAGLGTYEVLCKSDENGEYGYCQQLHNTEKGNTIESIDELIKYLSQLRYIDKICNQLGITDLHCFNVITCDKIAYIIDAEAFLMPSEIPTGIFHESGAGNTFDPFGGMPDKKPAKNKIYFTESIRRIGGGGDLFLAYQMTEKDLKRLGIDLNSIPIPEISEKLQESIQAARIALQIYKSRFIIEDTNLLKLPLIACDPKNNDFESCVLDIQEALKDKGFVLEADSNANIIKGIQEDILHNDVPVFYFDPQEQYLIYHHIVIGKKHKA